MQFKYSFACVLLLSLAVQAQQPTVPGQIGSAPMARDVAAVRDNTVTYGVTSSMSFDDNATGFANVAGGNNFDSSVQPQLGMTLKRPRFDSTFSYAPGFTYNTDIFPSNTVSHALGEDFQYYFSKRFSVHVKEAFSLTSNPFESLQASSELPSFGILNRPNPNALGANLRSRTEQVAADAIYLLGPHSSVVIGGDFNTLNYGDNSSIMSGPTLNSRSWEGHASYSHQLTPRYSFSLLYEAQNFSAADDQLTTLTHEVLGFWTVSLKRSLQFSVFAGPEFSQISDSLPGFQLASANEQVSSVAGGGSMTWQGKHNGLSASFVQVVNDSGISGGGAANVRMANLQAQRQLSRKTTANVFANYVSNNQLGSVSTALLTDSVSAGAGLSRTLGPHLGISISAFRQQFIGAVMPALGQQSHDVASISLSYKFARPIGR